jgi:AraC family transcriptional regulator
MKQATLNDYKQRLLRVLVHVQRHLDDPLDLDVLAGLACFSPFHFHRIFKGMIGESVMEYVRRLRLERAATQLKLGSRPVTRIALDAGYETHEAFTRSFKALFGLSPSRFRSGKKMRLAAQLTKVHYRNEGTLENFRTVSPGGKTMDVQIKKMEPKRVAFLRHVGPYSEVGQTWDRLLMLLGKDGWIGGNSEFIGVCYDDPEVTPQEKIRYDACVTVDDSFEPFDDIGALVIPGGEYAMMTHFGPYDKLNETYARLLGQWIPRSGRELRSTPCFEAYLTDPHGTDPNDNLTDVYAPLEPCGAETT